MPSSRSSRHRLRLALIATVALSAPLGCSGSTENQGNPAASNTSGPAASPKSDKKTAAEAPVPPYSDVFPGLSATVATARGARVRGKLTEGNQSVTIDVSGSTSGNDALAHVTDSTGTLTVLRISGTTYVRATQAYWARQIGNRAAKVIGTAWVPMPQRTPLTEVTVAALLKRAVDTVPSDADLRENKVARTTVDGKPALVITSADSLRTLTVATGPYPFPLRYTERAAPPTPAAGAEGQNSASSAAPLAATNTPLMPAPPTATTVPPGPPSAGGSSTAVPQAASSPSPPSAAAQAANGDSPVVVDLKFTHWDAVPIHFPPPKARVVSTG